MKKELQNKLYKNYPRIFRQKDLASTETAMCWGIACGDGWYHIIDELSATIQDRVEWLNGEGQHSYRELPEDHKHVSVEATQVKEKWGSLRFYLNGSDEYIDGAISLAESLSSKTCSQCGIPRRTSQSRGWIHSLCENCKIKNLENQNEN